MIVQKLQILIDAQDRASQKLKGVEGRLQSMQGQLRKVGMASMAMGTAIVAGAALAVKAFQGQERAEMRLAHLTKQVSGATDEQIQKLKDQAAALQKVGVVGDEVTMVGQSQLATFALNTDQIGKLTPVLLDMMVATKGVNATQEDGITIANAVGRAIDGGAGALTRYGISLTDTQKELFRLADREERVVLLAEILEGNFGGLNKAARETTEGGIKALKMAFGDLMETIGEPLAEALDKLIKERLEPLVEKTQEWIEENPELFEQLVLITTQAGLLMIPLGAILMVLPGIIAAIKLFNPLVAAGAIAIGRLAKEVVGLLGDMDALQDSVAAGIKLDEQRLVQLRVQWKANEITTAQYKEQLKILQERQRIAGEAIPVKIGGWVGTAAEAIKDYYINLYGVKPGQQLFEGKQEGGYIPKTKPYLLHEGETVIPADKGVGNTFNFNFAGAIISNKDEFVRQITEIMNRKVRFSYLK